MKTDSVTFTNPPLVEVAFSVQFDPIQHLTPINLAEIWSSFRDEFPKTQEMEPISDIIITPPSASIDANLDWPDMIISPNKGYRIFALSKDEIRVIQLQNSKLVFNWRRLNEHQQYPSYRELYPDFEEICKKFEEKINLKLKIQFSELTYANHIPITNGSEYQEVFPFWTQNSIVPSELKADLNFAQSSQWLHKLRGPVEINSQTRIKPVDGQKLILMQITARSVLNKDAQGIQNIKNSLDKAHDVIIDSFMHCTSAKIKKTWGYQEQ